MQENILTIQKGMSSSLSLITTLGSDLSENERNQIIRKAYMSSRAVKDFVIGELDLETFLDIQEVCLLESSMDEYLDIVEVNIANLNFAELLLS
jgi:hypothetical protein